jgi:hypothetical protein
LGDLVSLSLAVTLGDDQLNELADLVAARLSMKPAPMLVDAATVADALGISRDTVYARAAELGGVKIGDGARPRWRFNLDRARDALQPRVDRSQTPRRRRASNARTGLLPVHGDTAHGR